MIRFFFSILSFLSAMTFVHAQTQNEGAELKNFIDSFDMAWNTHNSKILSSFWISDGDWMTPKGNWIVGQNQIDSHFSEEGVGTILQSIDAKRFLSKDLVFVDTTARLSGILDKNKKDSQIWHASYLLGKVDDKWKILSLRMFQFQSN